jgi:hypothetical protein
MTAYALGYLAATLALAAALGAGAAWAMRRSARRLAGRGATRRRRMAPVIGLIVAALSLGLPAIGRAQEAPVWSDEAVANLRGFLRGFGSECEARCDAGDPACAMGCTCLGIQLSYTLDPATLEAGGRAEPSRDDITAFVVANRDAFASAYETCEVPIP